MTMVTMLIVGVDEKSSFQVSLAKDFRTSECPFIFTKNTIVFLIFSQNSTSRRFVPYRGVPYKKDWVYLRSPNNVIID